VGGRDNNMAACKQKTGNFLFYKQGLELTLNGH